MRRRSVGLGVVLGTLVTLSGGLALAEFPALKIDDVVIQSSGEVRVHFSLLDARLRQVKSKQLESVTLLQVPEGSRAEPLFTLRDGEVEWLTPAPPGEDEEAPGLTVASELDTGMATAVVVSGHADPSHTRGTLGESIRQGAGLFFKKLGSRGQMNVYWVGDEVQSWVRARGRSRGLTPMTSTMRAECEAWALRDKGENPEETKDEEGALMEGEAHCGLATDPTELSKILKSAGFEGYYPHLFGLNAPLCGIPEHGRATGGELRVEDEGDKTGRATGLSGFEMALQTLVREAKPEQRKALVLLGDGRDGYIYPAGECRAYLQRRCREDNKSYSAQRDCMKKGWTRFVVAAQERFRDRVGPWIALAKAAGVRVFSVVHPDAPDDGRERLELLSWRTGGTARISEDANEVVDLYNELVDELNGQHVLTFTDLEAIGDLKRTYQLKVRAGGSTFVSGTYGASVPEVDLSWRGKVSGWRGQAEGRLGKKGVLAIGAVLGLILAFILFRGARGLLRAALSRGRG